MESMVFELIVLGLIVAGVVGTIFESESGLIVVVGLFALAGIATISFLV